MNRVRRIQDEDGDRCKFGGALQWREPKGAGQVVSNTAARGKCIPMRTEVLRGCLLLTRSGGQFSGRAPGENAASKFTFPLLQRQA